MAVYNYQFWLSPTPLAASVRLAVMQESVVVQLVNQKLAEFTSGVQKQLFHIQFGLVINFLGNPDLNLQKIIYLTSDPSTESGSTSEWISDARRGGVAAVRIDAAIQ